MITNKNYYVTHDKKKKDLIYLEYDKLDGYKINPKAQKKDELEVNKIIFVNPELSEKIIRKKIDKKILELLQAIKDIDESGSDEGAIKQSLIDAEKLRLQIINNYVKYLGHTYESLTMKKIQLIINELRYRLFSKEEELEQDYNNQIYEGRRGR